MKISLFQKCNFRPVCLILPYRQKRVVRIVERGVTRVTEPNVSLVLKSAELILLMSAIVNILNGKGSSKWGGMSPVSMENIALFFPA
jgi:hypothetical protein